MAEQHLGTHPPKTRLESLSDLVFGLALSIGALSLIGQKLASSDQLLLALALYGFSYLILIQVWSEYSSTMTMVSVETREVRILNMVLLFLVSAEPFLFNLLTTQVVPIAVGELASILYALDLGAMHAILALFSHSVAIEKKVSSPTEAQLYSSRTESRALVAAAFAMSALPVFWEWTIYLGEVAIHARFVLWVLAPVIAIGGMALIDQCRRLISRLQH